VKYHFFYKNIHHFWISIFPKCGICPALYRYSQDNGDLVSLLGENQHRFQFGLA
jgi:hypothetical protein